MTKKGTRFVNTLTENYAKTRIESVDKNTDLVPHFYNQRLLNKFKKLLKKSEIKYITYYKGRMVIIDQFNLIIFAENEGRFYAKNKTDLRGLEFSFNANSTLELIVKLLRFRIIGIGIAKQICEGDKIKLLPKSHPKNIMI